jgi:Viral BACON domain
MRTCIYCGAELPRQAGFCANCGQLAQPPIQPVANQPHALDAATMINIPDWGNAGQGQPGQAYATYGTQSPLNNEEDEEEKRRRAAPLGFGLIGLAREGQPPAGNVPMIHDTLQAGGVPLVHGIPPITGDPFAQNVAPGDYSSGFYASQTQQISHLPQISAPPHIHHPPSPPMAHPVPHPPPGSHHPGPHHPNPGGCAPAWLILLFAAILIIASITSIGLTILAPSLSSLSGSTDVTLGGSLQLHGTSFIPGSSVTFTLDNTTPLFFTHQGSPKQAFHYMSSLPALGIATVDDRQLPATNNAVTVGVDGTFKVTFTIDQGWKTGQHTIRASERFSPRSASITITVHRPGEIPAPSPTATASPTATDTPSSPVTPSPSSTPSALSCINPGSVTLGPVSENYAQAVSTQVALCASGAGVVNWAANWDQNQASWLKLGNSSGQIQASGQQQITVSALATNLKAGNYSAVVTFSSQQGAATETLNVSFTVQTGCIRTSQQAFRFTGVAGTSDPQSQTIVVSNCGIVGTWSTSVSTDNNVHWLSVAPASGGLNGRATQNATISTSILHTQLAAGTYNGSILFAIGSNQVTVSVALIVQAAPKIIVVSPNPPSFYANKQCTLNQNFKFWTCIASISNSSQSLSLSWKSSSSGAPNITFKPSSATLPPGGGQRVIITVPENSCQTPTRLSFVGPANTANISWSCSNLP